MNGVTPSATLNPRIRNRSSLAHAAAAPLTEPQPVSAWVVFAVALASSLLLYLCYFPVAWGFLGWVALAPFLVLVRARIGNRARYWTALAVGVLFYVPVLQWMRVADSMMYITWLCLALYIALFYPLSLFFIRFVDRKTSVPLVLSVPVVWTAVEFLRSTFLCGGFSWYQLGHSQHDYLPVIQIADLTGAYGVSFLLAAFNALLVEVVSTRGWFPRLIGPANAGSRYGSSRLAVQMLGVGAVVVATLGYGWWQLRDDTYRPGPRVALIQGNLDQRIRNQSQDPDVGPHVLLHYESLAMLAGSKDYRPDLIVWPETSYPYPWAINYDGDLQVQNYKDAQHFVQEAPTYHLIGLDVFQEQPDLHVRRYNSAILLTPQGDWIGRYDKIHRVPFGEYVPFKDTIPAMKYLAPYPYDYSIEPGKDHTRFAFTEPGGEHRRFTFGTVICYEDTDPEVARPYGGGDGQPPADFVVNISNDGWFNGTSEHEEHLAVCRFRAIECRRSVVRSVNMGISAVIDADGRVLQPQQYGIARPTNDVKMREKDLPRLWDVSPRDGKRVALPLSQWHEYKKVQGVMLATVPLDSRTSLYARLGDWLPWLCWLLLSPVVAIVGWQMIAATGRMVIRLPGVIRKPVTVGP